MNSNPILDHAKQVQALQVRLAELAMQVPMPPEAAPDRHHIGYQEFGLAFHHALSIVSLVNHHETELAASAFALVRPMYETLQRGWWFTLCASDAQAARLIDDDAFVGGSLTQVAAAIDVQPPFQNTEFFSRFAQEEWNLYHSFTHGGRAALAVYGHRPNLDPDFDPGTIVALLDNAARMSAVAALGMCWVCGHYEPARVDPIYRQVVAIAPDLDLARPSPPAAGT
ncbi:hypothetical protein QFW77_14540 [Luteimonas sp. RD2P54]|uniref:Uncharacterized protein n=1 Tax=Luteimonas endophytica TaxID=3042023 RepID=A0ABT6JBL9_9GAMM|nr:hypothetical protein [Luteimonas endophytica]MDH5824196.1 hypothetical protein [Luteimonas endophytica]